MKTVEMTMLFNGISTIKKAIKLNKRWKAHTITFEVRAMSPNGMQIREIKPKKKKPQRKEV